MASVSFPVNLQPTFIGSRFGRISNQADRFSKTFLSGAKKTSIILADFYTTNGIFCLVRISTAYMDMLSLSPSIKGLFKDALYDLNSLKPLYTATMLPVLAKEFFRKDMHNNDHFLLPHNPATGKLDFVKLLFFIGGLCDTLGYVHKTGLCRIELFTIISNKMSPITLFTFNGVEWRVNNTPILNGVFESTKEIFLLAGSLGDVLRWVHMTYKAPTSEARAKQFEPEALLKLTGSMGRCICLSLSRVYKGSTVLKTINFVMQHCATIGFIIKNEKERRDRSN